MNKRPIEWHERNLVNKKQTLDNVRQELERIRTLVHRMMDDVALSERQIAEAKRRGMLEFDQERLLIKRSGR